MDDLFTGTCSLLRPFLGPMATQTSDFGILVHEQSVPVKSADGKRASISPTFVVELHHVPYSAHFEYPCVAPNHLVRFVYRGQVHTIATGSHIGVAGGWVYCQCYRRGDSVLLGMVQAGVVKVPIIAFGDISDRDLGSGVGLVEMERVCRHLPASRVWKVELLFPEGYPYEVMGWWDAISNPPSTSELSGKHDFLVCGFAGWSKSVAGETYVFDSGEYMGHFSPRRHHEVFDLDEVVALQEQATRVPVKDTSTYRIVEPKGELDVQQYFGTCLLLEITETWSGVECGQSVDEGDNMNILRTA